LASKSKKNDKSGRGGAAGGKGSARKKQSASTAKAAKAKPGEKPKRRPSSSKAPFGRRLTGQGRGQGKVRPLAPIPRASEGGDARRARETTDSLEAAKAAIEAALDKKALLPVLIDVSSLASYTDFIGIVSGRSDRQVDAIAEGILAAMKARGRSLLGQEGSGSGRWTLLDFGDVVIHVFYHPVREFYDLESLWVDAPRVQLRIPPEAILAQPDALYGNL
jgi:ribosome-associated protein